MADSVDRVFVHALNTVKKIPRTGSARPPPSDRLRLYGLYKQAMEGDVAGVMERPGGRGNFEGDGAQDEELRREREKWDAWDAQKGCSRTEAKRRYIEALIETMHKYASATADARELVAELEFVWDQIKHNSATSSSDTSPLQASRADYMSQQPPIPGGLDKPMRVISPISQDDEAERDSRLENYDDADNDDEEGKLPKKTRRWRKKVEMALERMTAEMAALREQIHKGREFKSRKRRSVEAWVGWCVWLVLRHVVVDVVVLGCVLLWMRRRRDGRLEDLVRGVLRLGREYVRKIVPAR